MSDLRTTAKDVGSYVGGKTYFGSDPKEEYKSDLQPPPEPQNEEENKATLLRCEKTNLVEEQATQVFVQKDDKMKNMDSNISDFCSRHVHPQPCDPWGGEYFTCI